MKTVVPINFAEIIFTNLMTVIKLGIEEDIASQPGLIEIATCMAQGIHS